MGCCKSKDKCESKYLGISRVCSDKTADATACDKIVDAQAVVKGGAKPWFYKRFVDSSKYATLMSSLVSLLALLTILAL